ncbi:hypothetical protein AB0N99_30470 [Streptomyces sp. NPDC093272]|uniref:hypothetical protein n=1 Tax=Streptomyces sp. NPDC093272 TaxID=3154981 RepID=UPI0034202C66
MVTLSVTGSRIADVLTRAADAFRDAPWDPHLNPLMAAIDTAAGFVPGKGSVDAEDCSLAAWDALCRHLGDVWPGDWERTAGRRQDEVEAALRGAAAKAVTA